MNRAADGVSKMWINKAKPLSERIQRKKLWRWFILYNQDGVKHRETKRNIPETTLFMKLGKWCRCATEK